MEPYESQHWKWLPGMLLKEPRSLRILKVLDEDTLLVWDGEEPLRVPVEGLVPDLEDPATKGCVWDMVYARWGPHASALASQYGAKDHTWVLYDGRMDVEEGYGHEVTHAESESHLLNAALTVRFPSWELDKPQFQ
jgi:hypothetical protein